MQGVGLVLKVYRDSEYEYGCEEILEKIDKLILNNVLEQRKLKLRNRKVLLANLPRMINLFAVDTFRGSFLRKIKIPDYIWYEYMNKS